MRPLGRHRLRDPAWSLELRSLAGDWNDPNDGNGTVVALDIRGADSSFEDPALRRVVATAEAPERVTFATDLIGDALDVEGGAS